MLKLQTIFNILMEGGSTVAAVTELIYPRFAELMDVMSENPDEYISKSTRFSKGAGSESQKMHILAIHAAGKAAQEWYANHKDIDTIPDIVNVRAAILDKWKKGQQKVLDITDFDAVNTTGDNQKFDTRTAASKEKRIAEEVMRGVVLSKWREFDGPFYDAASISAAEHNRRNAKRSPFARLPPPPVYGRYNFEDARDIFIQAVEASRSQMDSTKADELIHMLKGLRQYATRGDNKIMQMHKTEHQYDTPDELIAYWEAGKRNFERQKNMALKNALTRRRGF